LVAAGAALWASRQERTESRTQAAEERRAQRALFEETLARADAERERVRLDMLQALLAELQFNYGMAERALVDPTVVPFELTVMRQSVREVASLPGIAHRAIVTARQEMTRFNSLAYLVNRRQPGATIASEPPLNPEAVGNLAESARPAIRTAIDCLHDYITASSAGRQAPK
jgi:hypothetical protein